MNTFWLGRGTRTFWLGLPYAGEPPAEEEVERNRLVTSGSTPSPLTFQLFYEPGAKKLKKLEYTRTYRVIENKALQAKIQRIEEEARYKARKRRNKAIALLLLDS